MKKMSIVMLVSALFGSGSVLAQGFVSGGVSFEVVKGAAQPLTPGDTAATGIYQGSSVRVQNTSRQGTVAGSIVIKHDGSLQASDLDLPDGSESLRVGTDFWLIKLPAGTELLSFSQQLQTTPGVLRVDIDVAIKRKFAR